MARFVGFIFILGLSGPALALDTDADGLDDAWEVVWGTSPFAFDTDQDGLGDGLEFGGGGDLDPGTVTNALVADTDGDGLLDGIEDRNHNGRLDADETSPIHFDTDGDSIDDKTEVGPDPMTPLDTDKDGVIDARDHDSDGDGATDKLEAGDSALWTTPDDTDQDGTPDFLDGDADQDGIPDAVEVSVDATLDGQPDLDVDKDGTSNRLDLDSDSDGKPDAVEGTGDEDNDKVPNWVDGDDATVYEPPDPPDPPEHGDPPPTPKPDPDPPGPPPVGPPDVVPEPTPAGWPLVDVPTATPPGGDSDGDGLDDVLEMTLGTDPADPDSDGDTLPDGLEVGDPAAPADTDGDGELDALDLDADGDTIPDFLEAGGDGAHPADTDGDGVADFRDLDSDADDLGDEDEVTVYFTSPVLADTDGGTVPDGIEVRQHFTDPLDPSDDLPAEAAPPPVDPWAGAHVQGGVMCTSGGRGDATGTALLLALMGYVIVGRRRRLRRARRFAGAAAVLLLGLPSARAQGLDGQTLTLTAPGTGIVGTHAAATLGQGGTTASLTTEFLRDPLVIVKDGAILRSLVHDRVDLTTHGAFGVLDWLDVGFDMPVVLHQSGALLGDDAPAEKGMGDLRLWTKVCGLRERRFGVDLGAVVTVGTPTGNANAWMGVGGLTLDAALLMGRTVGPVRLAMSAGYRMAPERRALDLVQDDRLSFGLAGTYEPFDSTFGLHLALTGSAAASAPFDRAEESNLEATGAVTWIPALGLTLQAGFGFGVLPGAGTPSYRAFAGVGWAIRDGRDEDDEKPPADSDGDGIVDVIDRCVDDPEDKDGFEDHDGCPDPDNDRDGILDAEDKCPDSAEDKDGFQDEDGCPDEDNDEDGIKDPIDKCPNEPENKNGVEDEDGCPDPDFVKLDVERGRIEVLSEAIVQFDWNRADVPDDYIDALKQVAHVLKTHPEIELLRVEGHASGDGDANYNLELSRERAAAVVGFLLNFGVPTERVIGKGYGATRMKVKAVGPKVNHINRRVEFIIAKPAASNP